MTVDGDTRFTSVFHTCLGSRGRGSHSGVRESEPGVETPVSNTLVVGPSSRMYTRSFECDVRVPVLPEETFLDPVPKSWSRDTCKTHLIEKHLPVLSRQERDVLQVVVGSGDG